MKRALLIVILLLLLAPVLAIAAFNMGLFQSSIQRTVEEKSGASVSLGPVRLLYTWPPMARVGPTVIRHPLAEVQWRELDAQLLKLTSPYSVRVHLRDPAVKMTEGSSTRTAQTPESGGGGAGGAGAPPISLELLIENGAVTAPGAQISSLNLNFRQQKLMQSAAHLNASAQVKADALPLPLAVKIVTEELNLTPESVGAKKLTATMGGLTANVHGTSLLKDGRHRWVLDLAAQNLATLPQPAGLQVAKNWRGQAHVKLEVAKDNATQPWRAEGDFQANDVGADLAFKDPRANIDGPLIVNGEGKFLYNNSQLEVPKVDLKVDLDAARVQVPDMLSKAAKVPLKVSLNGTGDQQKLKISALDFELWNLKGQARGDIDLKAPWNAQLSFNVPLVNLKGSESILIPLRASPVQGDFGLRGSLNGPLTEVMGKAKIVIEDLSLKKFSAVATYEREGLMKVRGPVKMDLQSSLEWHGGLKAAQGRGNVDLGGAGLVLGPLRKEAGAKFDARFALRTLGNAILIDEMELASFVGNVGVKGQVKQTTPPDLAISIDAKPLNLRELRIAMPEMRDLLPKGEVTGRIKIQGKLDTAKPWHNLPIVVSGDVSADLPEYIMTAAPQPAKKPAPGAGPAQPAPAEKPGAAFLPDGELTRNLALNLKAKVNVFKKDDLQILGVNTTGRLANGKFAGDVSLREIFGGSVQLKNLEVPLLRDNPVIQGSAAWQNLITENVLGFVKPEYKTMASGRMAGTSEFSTVMPSASDFMMRLKARGDAHLEPMILSTVKIGEMINGLIAKAPMLKLKQVKSEPLRGKMKLQYELANGVLNLPSLVATDVNNSEVQLKGKVVLSNFTGDLVGTFYWAQAEVKGCILEGNADSQGRLAVPLAIQGNLMNPGTSVVGDIVSKLAGKALECEGKKVLEKAKQDGGKALEKELKKTLKNLLGK